MNKKIMILNESPRKNGNTSALIREFTKGAGWKDLGQVLAGGVLAIGDIDGKPIREEAKKLGAAV